jgi:hypothetical protein
VNPGGVTVGSGYSLAGYLATAEQTPEAWAAMLRCRSCGSLLLAEDQGVHEKHHTRLDAILSAPCMTDAEFAAQYTRMAVAASRKSRRNMGRVAGS